MIKLDKPTDKVGDILEKCICSYRDEEKKARLKGCIEIVKAAAEEYDERATQNDLCSFKVHEKVGEASKDEMKDLYDKKFVKQPGRVYYDKIKALAPQGVCPLCGVRIVSTLDHYLAKSKYPTFSVLPFNLIPSCRDCNTDKLDVIFDSKEKQTIHPYYDDIENELWLSCNVDNNLVATYAVVYPNEFSDEMYNRILTHFKVFKINLLYSLHAGEEIASERFKWKKLYKNSGSDTLKEYFIDSYESSKRHKLNSWKTALYRALSEKDLSQVHF